MVDVCFDDRGIVERRPEGNLMRANPGKKDLYDPAEEQRRAVVRGIYEGLVAKRLGMRWAQYKALRDLGFHPDLDASKRGIITQREFRAFVDKAQRLSIGVGRKQGYVSYMGKKPTPAGAAIAYARYGADPTVVQRMAKGHARALKLAKEKKAAALAKNRKLYEIMLMLARKEQTPRVVEEIVAGKPVSRRHPLRSNGKTKGIAKVGTPAAFAGVSTGVTETTPTIISAVLPARDVDRIGYYIVTFDGNNKKVRRILGEVRGWQLARNIDATQYAIGAVRDAPPIHSIIEQWQGKKKKKFFTVVGPKSRPADVFGERADAEKWAKYLDTKAASYKVPQVHQVWAVGSVFEVEGPQVENAIFDRTKRLEAQEARGEDVDDDKWLWANLQFEDEGRAEQQAAFLDWQEAKSGAMSIMGYRTAEPSEATLATAEGRWWAGQKAVENYNNLILAFDKAQVRYETGKSVAVESTKSTERRYSRVTTEDLEKAYSKIIASELAYGRAVAKRAGDDPDDVKPLTRAEAKVRYEQQGGLLLGALRVLDVVSAEDLEKAYSALIRRGKAENKAEAKKMYAAAGGLPLGAPKPSKASTAAQRLYAKQSRALLRSSALSRGEDPEKLAAITEVSDERGQKAVVNAIVKISEAEALKAVDAYARTKWRGTNTYAKVMAMPRKVTAMRATLAGGFNVASRAFGPDRRTGFENEESTLEHLTKHVWPNGKVPPKYLPRYTRDSLIEMDVEDLTAIAEEEGISKAQVTKMLQAAEISALAKLRAEREAMSGVEMIARGDFNIPMTQEARAEGEARSSRRFAKPKVTKLTFTPGRTAPAPAPETPPTPAAKVGLTAAEQKEMMQLLAQIREMRKVVQAAVPKKNGMWSAGAKVAVEGGRLAGKYGTRAYQAARAWASTPGGARVIAQITAVGVSMFGARAVKSGKLTPSQNAAIQSELERRTGQKADPATVALALHLAGE